MEAAGREGVTACERAASGLLSRQDLKQISILWLPGQSNTNCFTCAQCWAFRLWSGRGWALSLRAWGWGRPAAGTIGGQGCKLIYVLRCAAIMLFLGGLIVSIALCRSDWRRRSRAVAGCSSLPLSVSPQLCLLARGDGGSDPVPSRKHLAHSY